MKIFISKISPLIDAAAAHSFTVGIRNLITVTLPAEAERDLPTLIGQVSDAVASKEGEHQPFLAEGALAYFAISEEPDEASSLEVVKEIDTPFSYLAAGIGGLAGFAVSKFVG